jgi:putative Mg2+ transporter-C (MgtC) family protein
MIVTGFILKVFVSILLGAVIGFERELFHKPAGLRTNILVALGSMLAAYVSFCFASSNHADVTRIASNILTGLGFIGAGVVLHGRGSVHGITTAACVWICGVVGMAVGFGYYTEATVVSIVTFIVLYYFGKLERHIAKNNRTAP